MNLLPVTPEETVAILAGRINETLLASAPEGVEHLRGVQWQIVDGKIVNFWATGRAGPALVNYRPEFGWFARVVELA